MGLDLDYYYDLPHLKSWDLKKIQQHIDVISLINSQEIHQWHLQLINLKSYMPDLYSEIEALFESQITVTRLFVTPASCFTPIHTDAGYRWALNFPVINFETSFNIWYQVAESVQTKFAYYRDAHLVDYIANNQAANYYDLKDIVMPVAKVCLERPMLFNASIPHNVVTSHKKMNRIVLSVRLQKGRDTSYQIAQNILKKISLEQGKI